MTPEDIDAWRAQTRVFLTPIAAPSILGLFGFAGATFMVGANLAGWFGTATSGVYIFPFALTFGGLAQFMAAMWAYRARDGVATAMHGMWGSFWLAYGLLWGLEAGGVIKMPAGAFAPIGYWFIVLGTITLCGAVAALFDNLGIFSVLLVLAAGSAIAAVFYITGGEFWKELAGWVFMGSAWLAVYTATAMMLEGAIGRVVLPLGIWRKHANIPGGTAHIPLQFEAGEPGVRHGQ